MEFVRKLGRCSGGETFNQPGLVRKVRIQNCLLINEKTRRIKTEEEPLRTWKVNQPRFPKEKGTLSAALEKRNKPTRNHGPRGWTSPKKSIELRNIRMRGGRNTTQKQEITMEIHWTLKSRAKTAGRKKKGCGSDSGRFGERLSQAFGQRGGGRKGMKKRRCHQGEERRNWMLGSRGISSRFPRARGRVRNTRQRKRRKTLTLQMKSKHWEKTESERKEGQQSSRNTTWTGWT